MTQPFSKGIKGIGVNKHKEPNIVQRSFNYIKKRVRPEPAPSRFMNQNPAYAKYSIGKFSYGNPIIMHSGSGAKLSIGKFCSIGDGVTILLGGEHKPDWVTTYPFNAFLKEFETIITPQKGDVVIGNDVWIGMNAFILSGVCIGDGAVIGANTVIARDVAPYSVVVGNPARIIRKRFDDATIEELLKLKWWNWSYQKIKENIPLMLSDRIEEFISLNQKPNLEGELLS